MVEVTEEGTRKIVVFHRLPTLAWYYVEKAEVSHVLGGE